MPSLAAALALGAALCLAPAAAHPLPDPSSVTDDQEPSFPMPAAQFRERVNQRIEQARARMEEHITERHLPQDKADARRALFRDAIAKLNAKVDEVCADGTVTKEEAVAVHELARQLHHHAQEEGR